MGGRNTKAPKPKKTQNWNEAKQEDLYTVRLNEQFSIQKSANLEYKDHKHKADHENNDHHNHDFKNASRIW